MGNISRNDKHHSHQWLPNCLIRYGPNRTAEYITSPTTISVLRVCAIHMKYRDAIPTNSPTVSPMSKTISSSVRLKNAFPPMRTNMHPQTKPTQNAKAPSDLVVQKVVSKPAMIRERAINPHVWTVGVNPRSRHDLLSSSTAAGGPPSGDGAPRAGGGSSTTVGAYVTSHEGIVSLTGFLAGADFAVFLTGFGCVSFVSVLFFAGAGEGDFCCLDSILPFSFLSVLFCTRSGGGDFSRLGSMLPFFSSSLLLDNILSVESFFGWFLLLFLDDLNRCGFHRSLCIM
mmetsp:Transcript_26712/g.42385  ORF Transcript_26712/g.42385 Transcript_26712/m.42385 type:complete len:285 (-) Transcript_26712:431-1285(-)